METQQQPIVSQTLPTQPTITPTVIPPEPLKKTQSVLLLIAGILCMLLIGSGVGLYLLYGRSTKLQLTKQMAIPSPTPDPMADWKIVHTTFPYSNIEIVYKLPQAVAEPLFYRGAYFTTALPHQSTFALIPTGKKGITASNFRSAVENAFGSSFALQPTTLGNETSMQFNGTVSANSVTGLLSQDVTQGPIKGIYSLLSGSDLYALEVVHYVPDTITEKQRPFIEDEPLFDQILKTITITYPPPASPEPTRINTGEIHSLDPYAGFTGDTTPPSTKISIQPASPNTPDGWYTQPVTITLTATDNKGGAGVAVTKYSFNNGTSFIVYTAPVTISAKGTTTFSYQSLDGLGNDEKLKTITIKIR